MGNGNVNSEKRNIVKSGLARFNNYNNATVNYTKIPNADNKLIKNIKEETFTTPKGEVYHRHFGSNTNDNYTDVTSKDGKTTNRFFHDNTDNKFNEFVEIPNAAEKEVA